MSRKKFVHRLPQLPGRPVFKPKDHKTARLLEIMRGIAINNQTEEAQLFYPLRDVARHFHVTLSTIGRIYDQLEEEGILVSVRGSKTLLQGLSSGRHLSVLGFIGMPAGTASFVTLQDYRTFFIRTRRELRVRGFAVATVFFEPRDLESGNLSERIEKYDVDTVLWYRPEAAARNTFSQLKDAGVRVIAISESGAPAIRCHYDIQRDTAITAILRNWRSNSGIKSAIIVRVAGASAAKGQMLQTLLEEERLGCEFKSAGSERLETFLESLIGDRHRGIIFPSLAAAMFAFRAPEGLAKLMSHSRVAFTGGPVSIPFAQVPDVSADLVVVDWQLVAEQIVTDLISKKAFDRAETTVFKAQAVLGAPLNQYAQSL